MDFDVIHRTGIKNKASEALSNMDKMGEYKRDIEDDIPNSLLNKEKDTPKEEKKYRICFEWDFMDDASFNPSVEYISQSSDLPISQTISALLQAQAEHGLCFDLRNTIGNNGTDLQLDLDGFMVILSTLDGVVQKFIPLSMRSRILY